MLQQPQPLDFFLGSLAPGGFTGWFAEAAAEPGARAYLIKSGPGCGKSTLMKTLARRAEETPGAPLQQLHCSSDPQSLDGIVLPREGAVLLDATAPHTLDCKYPGAAERVVSLYETLDAEKLWAQRDAILALGARNAELMQRAAGFYALACGVLQQRRAVAAAALDTARCLRFAERLAARSMPPRRGAKPGSCQIRLLSAPTPGGVTFFYDTIPALADTVYAIHDNYGAASALLLGKLAEHARLQGYAAIVCRCPSDQAGKIDHLFIPELRLAFVTANSFHPMYFVDQKNIHTSRWVNRGALRGQSAWLNCEKRMAGVWIDHACEALTAAKRTHDALEEFYRAATDFAAVDRVCGELGKMLFGA